jgi:hypothetical protein
VVVDLDQHLSIFRPYGRPPGHEDQLTRAALIVMKLVPLAQESFLGMIACDRLSGLPARRFDLQTENLVLPDRGRPRSTLLFRPHLDRQGGTAATKGTTGTVDLAEEDHDVVWVRSCRL